MLASWPLVSDAPVAHAAPSQAADTPTMSIEVGVDGFADADATPVVTATISASRVLDGRVELRASDRVLASRAVQVAGGTTKTVYLVSASPAGFGAELTVTLYDGDRVVTTKSVIPRGRSDVEVVGVSPGLVARLDGLPDQVALSGSLGRAVFTELPPELADLGSAGLSQFDTIAVASADIAAFTASQRQALLVWVASGGVLVLDDAADVSWLPQAWKPGPAGWALAGLGVVRSQPGATTAQRWDEVVGPTSPRSIEIPNQFMSGFFDNADSGLLRIAGAALPSAGAVVVPLVVYAAVASLGLYMILRRTRRMTLAWLVIPALAVAASGVVYVAGRDWRVSGRPVAATMLDCSAGGCDAFARLLTIGRGQNPTITEVPSGWQQVGDPFEQSSRGGVTERMEDGSARLVQRLEAGQVGAASLRGPAPATQSRLVVTATATPAAISGTVRNDSGADLTDVIAVTSMGSATVGALAAGETRSFTLPTRPLGAADISVASSWVDPDGRPSPQAAIWWTASQRTALVAAGTIRVAGLAAAWDGLVSPSGIHVGVFSATAPIEPSGSPLPAAAVRVSAVRSPVLPFSTGLEDLVVRYLLPPTTPPGIPLVLGVGAIPSVAVLIGGTWQSLPVTAGSVAIPPTAVHLGTVVVRVDRANVDQLVGLPLLSDRQGALR